MKFKYIILPFFFVFVYTSGYALDINVTHTTEGDMENELTTAIGTNVTTDVGKLIVSGSANLNYVDLRAIRAKFLSNTKATFVLDISGAALENDSIPSKNESGKGAFEGMQSLKQIIIPTSVKIVGPRAFAKCEYLKTINFSEGLEKIYDAAFYMSANDRPLNIPNLPNSVKWIGSNAFKACKNLAFTALPTNLLGGLNSNKYEDGIIYGTTFQTTKISCKEFPAAITKISAGAFNCTTTSMATFDSITFHENFKSIAADAFKSQNKITFLRFKTATPLFSATTNPFPNAVDSIVTVWIPQNTKANYSGLTALVGMTIREAGTITYLSNGGIGEAPVESEKIVGETFTVATNVFAAPTGQTFIKWNTQIDGKGTDYLEGAKLTPVADVDGNTKSIELYAIWSGTTNLDHNVASAIFKAWVADGKLYLQTEKEQHLSVLSVSGKLLWQSLLSGKTELSLPKGIYIVKQEVGSAKKIVIK